MKFLIATISVLVAVLVSGQASTARLRIVDTPDKLRKALLDGASHIIISKHLDLTGLSVAPDSGLDYAVLATKPSTQTIRVCLHSLCFVFL
jgi:hypothetical protein